MTNSKTTGQQLEELIDRRTFYISTNGTGQGKELYTDLSSSDSIYWQTIRANAKQITVDRLYELKDEFGPAWSEELWKLVLNQKGHAILEKYEANLDQRKAHGMIEYSYNGKWVDHETLWENSIVEAHNNLKSQGYDLPSDILVMMRIF